MRKLSVLFFLVACSSEPETSHEAPHPPTTAAALPASAPAGEASSQQAKEDSPKTVDSGPRVLALSGAVTVAGKPAVVGTPVEKGTVIETADNAWARITLEPHSVLQIRPKTKFTIAESPRKKWSIQLALGALWSFLPKGSSYEVVTSAAVAGVRGTTLFVAAQDEKNAGICTCDGEVEITAGKLHKKVKTKHIHNGTMVVNGKFKPSKITKTPPGHDDVEGAALEKIRDTTDK